MYTKKIYFTANDFDTLKNIFADIRGVVKISSGKISARNVSSQVNPEFYEIENIRGIEIEFNPKKTDICTLMDIFFDEFNPYAENNLGVYYAVGEDEPQVELHMNFVATQGKHMAAGCNHLIINDPNSNINLTKKCYAAAGRLKNFEVEQ